MNLSTFFFQISYIWGFTIILFTPYHSFPFIISFSYLQSLFQLYLMWLCFARVITKFTLVFHLIYCGLYSIIFNEFLVSFSQLITYKLSYNYFENWEQSTSHFRFPSHSRNYSLSDHQVFSVNGFAWDQNNVTEV